MPKIDIGTALLEKEERAGDLCSSCGAAANEMWEPYCMQCGSYWRDVRDGLFNEFEEDLT